MILAGVFFLLYSFWPGFNWELALRIAPAVGLVALGAEVLYSAARPDHWRLDFLSMLGCLVIMGCCFALSFLPILTDLIDPVRQQELDMQREQYTLDAYTAFEAQEPQIRLRDVEGYLYFQNWTDTPRVEYSTLRVELRGPYETPGDFARDCHALTRTAQSFAEVPDQLIFLSEDPYQTFRLELSGPVQQDWTAEEMASELDHTVYETPEEERLEEETLPEDTLEIQVETAA